MTDAKQGMPLSSMPPHCSDWDPATLLPFANCCLASSSYPPGSLSGAALLTAAEHMSLVSQPHPRRYDDILQTWGEGRFGAGESGMSSPLPTIAACFQVLPG